MKNIRFQIEQKDITYPINLQETAAASPNTVQIDGKNYKLLGNDEQIQWLREQIPQFSHHENISLVDLEERLITIGAHDISIRDQVHEIGIATLVPHTRESRIKVARELFEAARAVREDLQEKLKKAQTEHPEMVESLQAEIIEAKKTEIDAYLRFMVVDRNFRGSVLVKRHGKILTKEGYGSTDQKGRLNTKDTRYSISSMGKMLTSSAIMRLMQDGKLSLNDKINDRLPGNFRSPLWEGITIEHLLTHTSGITGYGPVPGDMKREKPFTAKSLFKTILLFAFTEKKGLSDTDEINNHLPAEFQQDNWKGITVNNLQSHEPGFPKDGETRYKDIDELYQFITDSQNIKNIGGDLHFNPGEMFCYSNSGYFLLGQIIRQVSGKPSYDAYMEKMFEEIGMEHTDCRYNPAVDANAFWETPSGAFTTVDKMDVHISKSNAAGGIIISTVEDMEKFDQALYSDDFLFPATRDIMFTPRSKINFDPFDPKKTELYTTDEKGRYHPISGKEYNNKADYGCGFIIMKDGEKVGHDGGNHGLNSFFGRNLKEKDLIVVLGNIDRELADAGEITSKIARIIES